MASIGDLVANLTVDNRGFTKGLKDSRSQLGSFVGSVTSLVAPVAGALAGIWGAGASIAGAKDALQQQQKLASVLTATGGAAGLTATEISDYAGELQSLTNFEADATVGAAAMLAAFTNIRSDVFMDTLAAAQDLTAVIGGDLQSNVQMLGKALNDPADGLTRLARVGVTFTEQQQKQIAALQKSGDLQSAQGVILDALEGKFGGAAKAMADPWLQLQNTLGDVGENIGAVLLPSVNVLAESLNGMFSVVADGASEFVNFGIEAAVVLSNMGGLLTLAATQWELFFVKTALDGAHFFTAQMPAYLEWFGKNWSSVMLTAVDYAATLFINLGENIRNLWQSVVDFFSGNPVNFDWKPLTEGFKNSIADLPDVPKRMTTAFEKALQDDISSMTDHVSKEMDKQRADLTKKFNPLATVPVAPANAEFTDLTKADKKSTDLKAAFKGSQEAAAIATRGSGVQKLESYAAKQLAETKNQTKAIKENKPPELEVADF